MAFTKKTIVKILISICIIYIARDLMSIAVCYVKQTNILKASNDETVSNIIENNEVSSKTNNYEPLSSTKTVIEATSKPDGKSDDLNFVPLSSVKNKTELAENKKDKVNQEPKKELVSAGLPSKGNFSDALKAVAKDNKVLLTLIDEGFIAMSVNFYLTSIKPYGITNYLILTMHPATCSHLDPYGINCFFYKDMSGASKASQWGTQVFKDKMNVRTDMILDAMAMGYAVLHTDIDMIYYADPFKTINCSVATCDIASLIDTVAYNAGFLLINPTKSSREVYLHMKNLAKQNPGMDDQAQLNKAIARQKKQPTGIKIVRLSTRQYQCGKTFYEDPKRYFADAANAGCRECVVVHNNWIVSMAAKVYRQKEMHQWFYDGDNNEAYYTSQNRSYLTYANTYDQSDQAVELQALKSALAIAQILNRTLILPKFHCSKKLLCPLNSLLKVRNFETKFTNYRESTFLSHKLVPGEVKTSRSKTFLIMSEYTEKIHPEVKANKSIDQVKPKDKLHGLTSEEIVVSFSPITEKILVFHSMYSSFAGFTNKEDNDKWESDCKSAFVKGGYRQYE